MALYFVAALEQFGPTIEQSITERYPGNSYKIDSSKWWVNSSATTSKELSDQLGITSAPPHTGSTTGIVISVKGYFGRGPGDMWEWIATKASQKPNA